MKIKRLINAAVLALLLGSAAFVCAQDEKPQEPRPEEAKPPRQDAKPAQDEAKPPKGTEAKPAKPQEEGKPPKQQDETRAPKPEEHAEPAARGQQHAAGQNGGGHIPDDKFRSHFGRQHTFVVNQVTTVQGQPQFQYGGYSFTLVDAWPVGWAYTDNCYIDYIDGEYFLFDLLHPGVRIALVVVL